MALASSTPLNRQLRRVHRRLFLQSFINYLVWCLAGALILGTAWFVLQPTLLGPALNHLRWAVIGGTAGAGLLLAFGLALWNRPSALDTALTLDQRFGLKERVTTSLTLTPELQDSPAGQALLADANERVAGLQIGSRFPVKLSWSAALVPVGAALLAVVAIFYDPAQGQADTSNNSVGPQATLDAKKAKEEEERKNAMAELQKHGERADKDKGDKDKTDLLDDELTNIAEKPFKTEAEQKDRAADLTQAIDEIDKERKKEAAKEDLIREQLKKDGEDRLRKKPKEGPAKELQQALADGDAKKAQEAVDKLSNDLKDGKLSKEEQEQLKEQMEDMKKDLERLSRQKDEEKLLKEMAANGDLKKEALDREMDRLNKEKKENEGKDGQDPGKKDIEKLQQEIKQMAEKGEISKEAAERENAKLEKEKQELKELQEAAKDLEQAQKSMQKCEQCQKQGDKEGESQARKQAAESLQKAGDRLDGEKNQKEEERLTKMKERAQAARKTMLKEANDKQQAGKNEQEKQPFPNDPKPNRDQGGPGTGARGEEKDDVGSKRTDVKGNPDTKGKNIIVGDGPKGGKNRITPIEIEAKQEELRKESPGSVVKRGQVSKDKSEVTQEYFELIGDQKKPEEKK